MTHHKIQSFKKFIEIQRIVQNNWNKFKMIAHYLFSDNPKFQVLITLNNRDIDFSVDPFYMDAFWSRRTGWCGCLQCARSGADLNKTHIDPYTLTGCTCLFLGPGRSDKVAGRKGHVNRLAGVAIPANFNLILRPNGCSDRIQLKRS